MNQIPWIEEINTEWPLSRLDHHATIINGYPFDAELFHPSQGFPLVRIRDIASRTTVVQYRGEIIPDAIIMKHDILIGMDGDFNVERWRGEQALLNQRVCCVRPDRTVDNSYLAYFLTFPLKVINILTHSTTVKHLSSLDVAKLWIPLPPLATQRAIAAFLDRETAKIDALVDAEQRLLALLTEKRQALITHAVTRGLNPAAPMQDSGVEWIGAVPVGWEIPTVNARYEVALGKMLDTKTIIGNNLAPYLRNIDVQWHKINVKNLPEMDFNSNDKNIYALRKGDVLICEGGEIGRTAIWLGELETCYYQKALHRLRPITTMDYPQFFTYVMEAAVNIGVFAAEGNQSTIQHLTAEKLRAFRFPSPPHAEQQHIIEHIQTKTTKIDQLIATAERTIETLHERRTALISEAVTGQLPIAE